MNSQLISYFRGYVKVTVLGPGFERLINRLVESRIAAWDIRKTGENRGEMLVSLQDFFRLKPILKETGCRIRVSGRFGFPFLLDKLGRRKWFMLGAAAFLCGLYVLSSVIWTIEVTGNNAISEEVVVQAAKKEGVYPLQWKFRLKDQNVLSDNLTRALPNVAWVGVDIQGTTVTIRVVESTVPERRARQNPRHLVAGTDAVITRIFAERGVPKVGVNARVKRGDILISGILGNEKNRKVVVADGTVRGIVWYEYTIRSPLVRQRMTLNGNSQSKFFLVMGNRALQLSGYGQKPFEHEQLDVKREQLQWGRFSLPIGWMTEVHREGNIVESSVSQDEAKRLGLADAKLDLMTKLGRNAVIREEKILHERTDNGKVILSTLIEVEMDIAVEQLIME